MVRYRLGCCVSAHGLGHSARVAAVLEALADLLDVEAVIATTAPEGFFRSSFSGAMTYHHLRTDVGLVQRTALQEDIPATIRELGDFYPLRREYVNGLADLFAACDLILCDIAPAGIAAARKIGIPSVLVENFTWDWIFEGYSRTWPELRPYISMFRELYAQADYHVQAVPVCAPRRCDLRTGPVARRLRRSPDAVRRMLQLEPGRKVVLVSMGGEGMGGIGIRWPREAREIVFLVPGAQNLPRPPDNLHILPADSRLHHPDLAACCDAVIGKAGYSTIAEVYQAGVPFGYIERPGFPESGPLVRFVREEMRGIEITGQDLLSGGFGRILAKLLSLGRLPPRRADGADRCAAFLAGLLRRSSPRGSAPTG
ncbi:MAG TPA: hypothetical protein ENN06_06440 [Desulfobacteraceae bacterium]|nr:hypothetical protein [Desulfobacteraceae bacterium]